jgi:hypothetical protein
MAEFSLPQPGLFPADGDDCGAYTANEWVAILIAANRSGGMMVTGAAAPPGLPATQLVPNIGVYYSVADRLAVTSPGASQISIATGSSIVDGRVHVNDTAHTAVAITNPAANPRIDRVVVRQNYTGADYTSVNAPALVVDFNTASIAIISGAELAVPVEPALTQDEDRTTYWDIPLAQYQISVAGAITGLTDEREWVDAEEKTLFFPPIHAETTAGTHASVNVSLTGAEGWILGGSVDTHALIQFAVPHNFISDMQVTPILIIPGVGNVVLDMDIYYGACTEDYDTHTVTDAGNVVAVGGLLERVCVTAMTNSLSSAAVGDYVNIALSREGTNVLDTDLSGIYVQGVLVEYLGYGRR